MTENRQEKSQQTYFSSARKDSLLHQAMLRDTLWIHFTDITGGIVESLTLGQRGVGRLEYSDVEFPMPLAGYLEYCAYKYVAQEHQDRYIKSFQSQNLLKYYESGHEFFEMDFKILDLERKPIWVRCRVCLQVDETSGHVFGISFARDVSDQNHFKDIIEALADSYECIYYWNLERHTLEVERANDELASFIGSSQSRNFYELAEEYIKLFVVEEDQDKLMEMWSPVYTQQVLPEKNIEVEYKKRNADGSFCWIRCTLAAGVTCCGEVITMVQALVDITEQKQREEVKNKMLRDAFNAVEQANRAKTDFLSRMSHDIRTPMNAIIGMTAIAATHMDDKRRIEDCLNKITLSSKHLLALINEVLDMSKLENDRLDLSLEALNIREMMFQLISMLRVTVNEKNHVLTYQTENLIHEDVICDEGRLQQIMVNLISNAIKYTPDGGKINVITKELPSRVKGYGEYQFIVEDNGIGMTKEFIKKVFQPFERAEDSRVSKIHGTGLGTAIAQGIANMMNGSITAESKEGEGSRFTVTMPLKFQEGEEKLPDEIMNFPVLVVDDEPADCQIACEVLDRVGLKSEWVLSGAEAVDRVAETTGTPDEYYTIFLDWKMPGMDGIETTKKIREKVGQDIPIIILTAYDWCDIEEQARAEGITDFLSKPLSESKLYHTFNRLYKKPDAPQEEENDEIFIGKRILLVEDNDLNAEIAKELLEKFGLVIEVCENGKAAVNTLLKQQEGYYQCVLMDIQMPVMNGYEATKQIRSSREDLRELPIIAMTADAFAEDVRKALLVGMNGHLSKPINIDTVKSVLRRWL